METFIVGVIVGVAVIYLVKRYLRLFRSQSQKPCDCGCSECGQESACPSEAKSIQPRP